MFLKKCIWLLYATTFLKIEDRYFFPCLNSSDKASTELLKEPNNCSFVVGKRLNFVLLRLEKSKARNSDGRVKVR